MEEWIPVGIVFRTHGIRGEIKVYPLTDSPERFLDLRDVIIEDAAGQGHPATIDRVRFQGDRLILHLVGKDRIEAVEPLVKGRILIHRSKAVPLAEGRYYHADVIGLSVVTEAGESLGTVAEILETGSNDVYVVRQGRKEILLPAIEEVIREIDLERGVMVVHVMEGLLD